MQISPTIRPTSATASAVLFSACALCSELAIPEAQRDCATSAIISATKPNGQPQQHMSAQTLRPARTGGEHT